jgi:pSer/pThr/pTyr-binding forkhead associated (FHA) protein
VLDRLDERTITIAKVDPLQDAPGPSDDVRVDLGGIAPGTALLVVRGGEEEGQHFVLGPGQTRVGRGAENDIELDDITVSRHHCVISSIPGGHEVTDKGSLNGTYVNQRRVDTVELAQGDELQIGKFRLVYLESPGPT